MNEPKPRYWFYAKRYGWGWGLPATWQGWVVSVVWFAVLISVSPWLVVRSVGWFVAFIIAMVVVILTICWIKGEPPRWRWGKE